MHKGQVDIRGTPSDITSKYGIGYRLCISGIATESSKIKLHRELLDIEPSINIVGDQNFNETGIFEIILPTKKEEMIKSVVEHLEKQNIRFYLSANSLEEAFINLGERKKEHESEEINVVYSKLFSKSFSLTKSRVLNVLVYRRFKLLFGSTENWMRMVYLSILPALVATVIKRGGSFNKQSILCYFFILAYFAIASCVAFAQIPFEERTTRRRYMLKLIGVDSNMYYGSLIFSDIVIFGTCIPIGVLFMVLLNVESIEKDFFKRMNTFEVTQLSLAVFFWCMGYIGQAYSVSYLTNDKVEGMVTMLRILIVSHVGTIPLGGLFVLLYLFTKFWFFGVLTAIYCACLPSVGFMAYLFLLILGDFLNNQSFEDYFSSSDLINKFME